MKVTGKSGLEWTVKVMLLPTGLRPLDRIAILDAATPRRTTVEGMSTRVPDAVGMWTGPLPLGVLLLPASFALLPFVLLLRRLRLLPWTVEARAHPWGRRYPPIVFAYETRGRGEALRAVTELAAKLARGDGAPVIDGAELVPQPANAQDGRRPVVNPRSGKLYGGR